MKSTLRKYGLAAGQALLAILFAACLSAPLHAQDPASTPPPPPQGEPGHGPHGDMAGHQLEHLTRALNLTPDQVTQVKAIQDDSRSQMMALHQDQSTAPSDKHAKMMALHQAEQGKIRAVLNDAQKAKFDTMQQRMHDRQEQRRDGDQPPPQPPPAA